MLAVFYFLARMNSLLQKFIREEKIENYSSIQSQITDHDSLVKLLTSIAVQISDDKPEYRANYLTLMAEIMSLKREELDIDELSEEFMKALPAEGHRVVKRIRRLTYVHCLLCMCRCGLVKQENVQKYVNQILFIGTNNVCFRTLCYKAAIDIVTNEIPKDYKKVYGIFNDLQEDKPSSADSLYLWISLKKAYPKIPLSQDFFIDISDKFFKDYDNILDETTSNLNSIHPLWIILSDFNFDKLYKNSVDYYMGKENKQKLLNEIIAAIMPKLNSEDFINLLQNKKLVEFVMKIKENNWLRDALEQKINIIVEEFGDDLVRILDLIFENNKSYISTLLEKIIVRKSAKLSEQQIMKLISYSDKMSFNTMFQLLCTQRNRKNNDLAVITKLFEITISKIETEKDKIDLSGFIGKLLKKTSDEEIISLKNLCNVSLPSFEQTNSIKTLVNMSNQVIEVINSINKLLKIEKEFQPIEEKRKSFIDFITLLIDDKIIYISKIGKLLLEAGYPILDSNNVDLLTKVPKILRSSVQTPSLCFHVLPAYYNNINKHTKKLTIDGLNTFPITSDNALKVIEILLSKNHNISPEQQKIIDLLFSKLETTTLNNYVLSNIDKIIENSNVPNQTVIKVISSRIKLSSEFALVVIQHLVSILPKIENRSSIRNIENIVEDCLSHQDIDPTIAAQVIYSVINCNYPSTSSGKRKAEKSLLWALKTIKHLKYEIQTNIFNEMTENINSTGSKSSISMLKEIINMNN